MQKPLQLENMSTSEKLTIINDIWNSLIQEADIHIKFNGYFRLLSKTFPYAIYYLINGEFVDVYAVLHCRKHPDTTTGQLQQRFSG